MKLKLLAVLIGALCLALPGVSFAQCGDFNNSGTVNVSDMTDYVDFLWNNGAPPTNYPNADIDDYEVITMSDLVKLLQLLYMGGSAPTCPPTNGKLKGIPNANIYLDVDQKNFGSTAGNKTIVISLVTGNKKFVYLDLPLEIYVGKKSPQKAQVNSVTINSTFTTWSNVGPGYRIGPTGSLLLSFGDYMGSTLGGFSPSNPQPMATVDISVSTNPGNDDQIYLAFDQAFPPVVSPYGSSHYPLIICDYWPKNALEAYEPSPRGPAVPSLTFWGMVALLVLLMGSAAFILFRRKKATV